MRIAGLRIAAALSFALLGATAARATDTITIALSNHGTAWDFSVSGFGERLGYFAEEGLHVEVANVDSTAAGLQAVIAGSVDMCSVAVPQFLAAGIGGAPIKMISSSFTGASDWVWYVKSDSPIKSFKDLKETNTISVSSLGSSSYVILQSLLKQNGVKANIVAAGSTAAVLPQVMTGQIDVGTDGNGLLRIPELAAGDIRPIAYGRDLDVLRNVTVRGLVVKADALAADRDKYVRFLRAYQKTIDWMYKDPRAVEWFAEANGATLEEAKRVREENFPPGVMDVREVVGLDVNVALALEFKRIDRAPTAEETARLFDPVWKPGTM
jgi:NitT/TauT family transport system substrate-binding protein